MVYTSFKIVAIETLVSGPNAQSVTKNRWALLVRLLPLD